MTDNMMEHKKGSIGYFLELAKKDGFEGKDAFKKRNEWRRQNGKMPDYTRIDKEKNEKIAKNVGYKDLREYNKESREKWAIDKGCDNFNEYVRTHRDIWANEKGYDSYNERRNENDWEKGKRLPMSIKEDCSVNFGVYKGEELFKIYLSTIFERVVHMKYGNKCFDFKCRNPKQEFIDNYHITIEKNKEYRIQSKVSSLTDDCFAFTIDNNENTDFFILVGFDNRYNLNVVSIWLIGIDEMIRAGTRNNGYTIKKIWDRRVLRIYMNTKSQMSFIYFKKYELTDEIDKLKKICEKFKEE